MSGPFYVWTHDGDCSNKTDTVEEARSIVAEFAAEDIAAYITNADNEVQA